MTEVREEGTSALLASLEQRRSSYSFKFGGEEYVVGRPLLGDGLGLSRIRRGIQAIGDPESIQLNIPDGAAVIFDNGDNTGIRIVGTSQISEALTETTVSLKSPRESYSFKFGGEEYVVARPLLGDGLGLSRIRRGIQAIGDPESIYLNIPDGAAVIFHNEDGTRIRITN